MYPLFVYGTLRSDSTHHHLIETWIQEKKEAYIYGSLYYYGIESDYGWYPYATKGSGIIKGEILYSGNMSQILKIADDFEDNGLTYERELYRVFENEREQLAWVYFIKMKPDKGKRIICGDWVFETKNKAK